MGGSAFSSIDCVPQHPISVQPSDGPKALVVADPKAAIHRVDPFEDWLQRDVRLAARRSLASMNLETIPTKSNRRSEGILSNVTESAVRFALDSIAFSNLRKQR